MMLQDGMIAFSSGAAAEAIAVLWVHAAERNQLLRVFTLGVLAGLSILVGIETALHTRPGAVGFVLGYGCGPLIGIFIKKRFLDAS